MRLNLEPNKVTYVLLILIAALCFNTWWTIRIEPTLHPKHVKIVDNTERYLLAEMLTLTKSFKPVCEAPPPILITAFSVYKNKFSVFKSYALSKKAERFNFVIDKVDQLNDYFYHDDNANPEGCKQRVKIIEEELQALLDNVDK